MPHENNRHWLGGFFLEPLRRVQQESRRYVAQHRGIDWRVIVVLLTTAVVLTIQEYAFSAKNLDGLIAALESAGADDLVRAFHDYVQTPQDRRLAELIFWAVGMSATYVILPAIVIRLVFRERLRDYGLKIRGMFNGAWVYLVMFAAIFPCVAYFSTTSGFLAKYPFYRPLSGEPLWPAYWIWEAFYIVQFFALEFFFRGFVLHGTRRRFGCYSIFVMMVPYCMIHFGKPMPETFGAIGAGIVLGFMSLKTRSVWLGALLHVAVALSMDLLALWHQGLLW